jgi:hypothetical protein
MAIKVKRGFVASAAAAGVVLGLSIAPGIAGAARLSATPTSAVQQSSAQPRLACDPVALRSLARDAYRVALAEQNNDAYQVNISGDKAQVLGYSAYPKTSISNPQDYRGDVAFNQWVTEPFLTVTDWTQVSGSVYATNGAKCNLNYTLVSSTFDYSGLAFGFGIGVCLAAGGVYVLNAMRRRTPPDSENEQRDRK